MSLTLLVGPTAVGKTVIWENLIRNHGYSPFKTHTTRGMREKEKQKDAIPQYHFLTREEFKEKIRKGYFFEHITHVGHYYGTSREDIVSCINDTTDWIGIVEIKGALNIKKAFPEVLTIFILPPSEEELKRRLTERNSESEEERQERLQIAFKEEIPQSNLLDFSLINEDIEESSLEVKKFIKSFHKKEG